MIKEFENILNPRYPNYVFKFKEYSLKILKELLYGEVYFSSRDEINDPYDTKIPYIFQGHKERYKKLIQLIGVTITTSQKKLIKK